MNKVDLELRFLYIRRLGCGNYKIAIEYRNKPYTCVSNNSLAYDAWKYDDRTHYTEKQALKAFYDECKRKNGLR